MEIRKIGKLYEYDNQFLQNPRQYGFVRVFQAGELCCCYNYHIESHKQVCNEISYILSGKGEFTVDGVKYEVSEGDFVLSYFGKEHSIRSREQSDLRYFYLGFLLDKEAVSQDTELLRLDALFSGELEGASPVCRIKGDTMMLFSKLTSEFYKGMPLSSVMIESLIKQILIEVYRGFTIISETPAAPPQEGEAVGNAVYNLISYIDNHLLSIDSIQVVAQTLGYSLSHLSHQFRKKTGMTIQEYLAKRKMELATSMLSSGRYKVSQVASHLQYDTVQSFSRAFKRVTGHSPSFYTKCSASIDETHKTNTCCTE